MSLMSTDTPSPAFIEKYWAKTSKNKNGDIVAWMSVPKHCANVGAVAQAAIDLVPEWPQSIADALGIRATNVATLMVRGALLHDIGKFSLRHQSLAPTLCEKLHGAGLEEAKKARHDYAGWRILRDSNLEELSTECILTDPCDDEISEELLSVITGHHGVPPQHSDATVREMFRKEDIDAAREFIKIIPELAPHEGTSNIVDDRRTAKLLAWRMAGFFVLVDWIGSDETFFPVEDDAAYSDVKSYYQDTALPRAHQALKASGVIPAKERPLDHFQDIFPDLTPTPLQKACERIKIDGPALYMIEDATGAGKTEAGLCLAARLMNKRGGFYWALPTMATAEGLYDRMHGVYGRLFESDASLILSHSRRTQNEQFMSSIRPAETGNSSSSEAVCAAWLSDSRKKSLLAQAGVGTIDQALLGVLRVPHQSLRLWGLGGSVLIVDEVHSCDAYVARLLSRVLEFLSQFGTSAILLSATMSSELKRIFAKSYMEPNSGDLSLAEDSISETDSFPLITKVGRKRDIDSFVIEGGYLCDIDIDYITDFESCCARVAQFVDDEKCVAWVRNTVDDAIAAYTALKERLGSDRVTLMHSRYVSGHRSDKENVLRDKFGPQSGALERNGHVVVSTQIIEQSLDLDFDEMVSDLAPIDLLIQRNGRNRRHARDASGNRIIGVDERGARRLHVYGPTLDPSPSMRWYSDLFPKGAYVYPNHGVLYRTASEILDKKSLLLASDPRGIIERVYGEESVRETPDPIQDIQFTVEGEEIGYRNLAEGNGIKLNESYHSNKGWLDEEVAPTRLGEAQRLVRIGVSNGDCVCPIYDKCYSIQDNWKMSEMHIPAWNVEIVSSEFDSTIKSWPDKGHGVTLIVLDQKTYNTLNTKREMTYCVQNGLLYA